MRKIFVTEFMTLDGVIEDPGGSEKTTHGGWSFQFGSAEAGKYKFDELFASDAILLGRVTYEGFAAAWPSMTDESGFADRMNSLPKYVVSTTLTDPTWNNTTVIAGDIAAEVAKLKEQPGQDIMVAGSGQLARTLMQHGLIDEYRLMVHPVVLGEGKRLFETGTKFSMLKLIETKPFDSGVVLLTYQVAPKKEETK